MYLFDLIWLRGTTWWPNLAICVIYGTFWESHESSRGQSQITFWALLKESSKLLGYLVIMDNGTKNMCQSPVIPVIWLLVTYLICKTGPIAHATPLSLVIWLFGYWWQLICKTGPCISSVTGYLVIWLLTFYYLVFLRPWRLRHFNIQLRHGLHALQIRHMRASSFESLKMLKGSCQKKTTFFFGFLVVLMIINRASSPSLGWYIHGGE